MKQKTKIKEQNTKHKTHKKTTQPQNTKQKQQNAKLRTQKTDHKTQNTKHRTQNTQRDAHRSGERDGPGPARGGPANPGAQNGRGDPSPASENNLKGF